jgi:ubiquitin-conjugating enzyme E2 N
LDILKKNWSPALQMKSVLLSIQSLLAEPNPDDPLNNEAASEWKSNKKAAESKAKDFTKKYAK